MSSSKGRAKNREHKPRRKDLSKTGYLACGPCPACGKSSYTSRKEARKSASANHPGQVMHAYECEDSGYWHLSSIPAHTLKFLRERKG